ncbi:LytTR family DNA-binding domain-containing protein [Zoogloea sp.]|uniref:LytR/AlgR family response regulator transcription factor n=1 Tax=Zoogloea sp. TaxID=49181 RepID=UPI00262FAF87|nr:LytTR family DNA-binding domain-containing protein [Zoogloea sp.]MDD3353716.1 LytTR family DNA-binding domain-containing protein [Zoogloea sp.]
MTDGLPSLDVLIVDDEAPARVRLGDVLGDILERQPTRIVGTAANGREALALLEVQAVDLVLTDIRMPVMDGVELARHLGRLARPPAVIFTTAHDEYAVRAFELAAVDYLLKPVRAARLEEAIAKARRWQPIADGVLRQAAPGLRSHFSVHERGVIRLVPVAEVVYLKAEQKYVVAWTRGREFLLDESLIQLEEEFGGLFLRIHRNCLVARAGVSGVARASGGGEGEAHWVVQLQGVSEPLPVSRRQWPIVRDALGV